MEKKSRPAILLLFMAFALILTGCRKDNGDELSEDDIINRIVKEHANLSTYRDNSTATMTYTSANPFTVVKKSKLVYSGDGRFRYDYYEVGKANNKYIIHRDVNMKVTSWKAITGETKTHVSLEEPLAAATGVSDMTAFIVPALLLPEEFDGHNLFKALTRLSRGEDEIIDGEACFLITGYNNADDLCSIYILKDTYLIKRYSDSHEYENFDFDRVIEFNPEMNITIPDSEFLFGTL
jgi:hypothetical protein